jgi:acetyl-CoA carboxylase carboxyltransferase component
MKFLFDDGDFEEIDARVVHRVTDFGMDAKRTPGDGVVTGVGRVDGRTVYAFSQDFASLGGSLGEAHARKICKVLDLAGKAGCAVVGINDSGGARIQEGIHSLGGYGEIFLRNTRLSGVVPQLSVVLGPCAGGAVYSPSLTDLVFMTRRASTMFVTGPKVVRAVTFEEVDSETLGGAELHSGTTGVAHFMADSEPEALDLARAALSYLPSNNLEDAPFGHAHDDPARLVPELEELVPAAANQPYDVGALVRAVVDRDSFLEVHARFARNVVVGFARLGGRAVGVVANNPDHLAGVLDIDASRKAARFIRLCDAFNLPVVSLVDVPGFLPGTDQERSGIISHGAKLLYAYCEATVPKLSVILRKAYGGAYIVMSSKHVGGDFNLAWPNAEIAVMGAEGASEILYRRELAQHGPGSPEVRELVEGYRSRFANPSQAAEAGYVDQVIAPVETRRKLCRLLESVASKRETHRRKKHGNCPM